MTIRIGIAGYGNLGRGVETALGHQPDMELAAIFTRRDPASVEAVHGGPVEAWSTLADRDDIDVMILCGGSKTDLPQQGPELAARFTTVDSFDTHAAIPEYFAAVDAAARDAGTTAVISIGWDPGLFSLNRMLGEAILPAGDTYTFWGRGLSQGHSDAIRRVDGVADGVEYTIPAEDALAAVRAGEAPQLATRDKHTRECFVVLEPGADAEAVRTEIVTMPYYFDEYDTTVTFVDADELAREHSGMSHGGFVLRSGQSAPEHHQLMEYKLQLDSNPEFTSSVLVAYARAAHRLSQAGEHGAKTLFDIAPGLLSPKDPAALRAELL